VERPEPSELGLRFALHWTVSGGATGIVQGAGYIENEVLKSDRIVRIVIIESLNKTHRTIHPYEMFSGAHISLRLIRCN
jgi:hypothetical protein